MTPNNTNPTQQALQHLLHGWIPLLDSSQDAPSENPPMLFFNRLSHSIQTTTPSNGNTLHYNYRPSEGLEQSFTPRTLAGIGRSFLRRDSSSIRLFPFPTGPMSRNHASRHPQFRIKSVHIIECIYCSTFFCHRGMKAILLGDRKIELYSTDISPESIQPVFNDYTAELCLYFIFLFNSIYSCRCLIRDSACLKCGNVVGYHVIKPCDKCLGECNNGHIWMFNQVRVQERKDASNTAVLNWSNLPVPEDDPIPSHHRDPRPMLSIWR